MGNIHTVGPNEALVISGGCCGEKAVRTIIGGWGWAWWLVTEVQRLSLSVMTLNPKCENVETAEGVPITVTGVAQTKIMRDDEFLESACEQFLGKDRSNIEHAILQTLEGHLRSILGTLSVESIYGDRDEFASMVRKVASPDVAKMGVEILSFTIKDVYDRVEYLNSLGRAQTANVKRDADIGVAVAEKEAGITEAECEKLRMDARYKADTIVAESTRNFEMEKAKFDSEVNTEKARCELAYQLQAAKEKQKIRAEEIEIDIVERGKQIELEQQEIIRNEKHLDATVRQPAEYDALKLEIIADGERKRQILLAQANAESIKLVGAAKANSVAKIGGAEAERMRLKADAYERYGDAAMLNLMLDTMPKVAAEIAAPLSKVDEIVLLGGQSQGANLGTLAQVGKDFTNLVGTVPPAVRALTGVDLSKCVDKIPGATHV